ncbi:hypothetical protein PanWU01x14_079220 [Parasponia andersonii]|uniref:Uncharacterized protein n=1 Tax=Parasponia andersonii TaxID=3476 RepID=A0A2P5DB84_PARAD|nr:hypothetical protein PanWU01x14_079220 [Parasponia andersonii]
MDKRNHGLVSRFFGLHVSLHGWLL